MRGLLSTDHKVIGRRFLWAGLLMLALGGALAMAIRWQWAYPGRPVPLLGVLFPEGGGAITPAPYLRLFTTHGVVMIFFAITPILIGGLGSFLLPLLIGSNELAFPRLSRASFWTFVASVAVLFASFHAPLGTASTGWTAYPPLSTRVGTPGAGQTLVLVALVLNGLSTVLGGINFVTTVLRCRAPGMGLWRLPLTVWGLFLTAILNVLFVPVLAAASLLLILDRTWGTQFFVAGANATVGGGGDPVLYQHLFWLFGHPEVYILILPVWGIVGDVLSFFARKPAYAYRLTVAALVAVTSLSGAVYAHHMYTGGLSPLLGKAFMSLTLLISLPGEVLVLNWLFTLWRGAIRLASPMLFALGALFVFTVGGLTGLYLATVPTDLYLHDTLFVVGHFHLTMAAATFLGGLCGIHFWYPKMFGRRLNEPLAHAHFWLTAVLLVVVFGGQLVAGYAGQLRRLYDPYQYATFAHLLTLNRWTSWAAFALAAAQGLFVLNVLGSLRWGPLAGDNPWAVGTLEWTLCASPPSATSFAVVPTVLRGPHAFADPEVRRALGRDWLGQAEVWPKDAAGAGHGG